MTFLIDQYARTTAPVTWDDLDLPNAFAEHPLSTGALRCLRSMSDVEAQRVDQKIHALPGPGGLHLVERALDRHGVAR